ncbi:hypothetical protein AC578_7434 [Pseudocercospora eumusae]|uniref:Uncharacterized protein n=1 Tax=Pseudocercospora eumusae TaxID=321146 RepID=A0A139GY54_9PEZI|nr:hypothetical protein AC578_7434 [Pseudocercospora eumusae]
MHGYATGGALVCLNSGGDYKIFGHHLRGTFLAHEDILVRVSATSSESQKRSYTGAVSVYEIVSSPLMFSLPKLTIHAHSVAAASSCDSILERDQGQIRASSHQFTSSATTSADYSHTLLQTKAIMSEPSNFWPFPEEVRCRIFDFYGAHHTITIDQRTSTEASKINIGLPPVSKKFLAIARAPILGSATWQFSDITAAHTQQLQATAAGSALRRLRHLRIDAREIDPSRLLATLSQSVNFKPWRVTIVGCTPQHFNITPIPAQTDDSTLTLGFSGSSLPRELRETTCRGFKTNGIALSPLMRALQRLRSLRDVRIEVLPCGTCTLGEIGDECDYRLLARTIEQITLCGRVGLEEENGQSRHLQRRLGEIEEEASSLIKHLAEREDFEAIGADVGKDMEEELTDDEGYDTLRE